MTAAAGIEVGAFNAAYLCEQDPDSIVSSSIEKDCVNYYFNQSIFYDLDTAHPHGLIKIGDYYFELGKKNLPNNFTKLKNAKTDYINQASEFYALAYAHGDFQVANLL
jgi:hypothetical protein